MYIKIYRDERKKKKKKIAAKGDHISKTHTIGTVCLLPLRINKLKRHPTPPRNFSTLIL